jgi:Domain of unknown function (DUF6458)
MGIGVGLLLIAVGAILTWAVTKDVQGIDIQVMGVILMLVGLAGILLDLIWWHSWRGPVGYRRAAYVEGGPAPAPRGYRPRGRRTVVEEEEVPAPAPPPGPPPP